MKYIIDFAYLLAAAAISPKVIYRAVRQKRYRTGWSERLGNIIRKTQKKCIWIHAVSVGEVNSTRTLVAMLNKTLPEYEIVISTTTDTGCERAKTLYGRELAVFYFPLDFSFVMRRAFERIRPAICLLMELEVWPNFAQTARSLGVPVVVVNGRLSERSLPRYRLIRPVTRWMFSKVTLFLAQSEEYAQRFKEFGVNDEKVVVTGSLKYDTAEVSDRVDGAEKIARQLEIGDGPVWVAGGTGPGEEKIIIETFVKLKQQRDFDSLRLVIVPRKPERFDEAAQLIEENGLGLIRYSGIKQGVQSPSINKKAVILGDTMGDLRKFYSLATVIFVGRSLVPMGGSDMLEAAALGKCTIFGPHTFNFKQAVDALMAGNGAIIVRDGQELFSTVQKCLRDSEFAQTIARNGQDVIRRNQGATNRSIKAITELLNAVPR